jgi:hypothetical protein
MSNLEQYIPISQDDLELIKKAKLKMVKINLMMKGLNYVGSGIESKIQKIPESKKIWLDNKIKKTFLSIIKANLLTMQKNAIKKPKNIRYKIVATASGLTGFFGMTLFAADLIFSTKMMMRSILDIARSEGENISDIEVQLSCLQVFALGGKSKSDDGLETSYYATRIALDTSVKQAGNFVAKQGMQGVKALMLNSNNPLIKLVAIISSRYSAQAIEKFIARGVPIAGAVGGASLNLIFIHHFQTMANAHFSLRRLERKYGQQAVMEAYNKSII